MNSAMAGGGLLAATALTDVACLGVAVAGRPGRGFVLGSISAARFLAMRAGRWTA